MHHAEHSGQGHYCVGVDASQRATGYGGADEHAISHVFRLNLVCVRCRSGHLGRAVRAVQAGSDHALCRVVKTAAVVGRVHFQMRAHASSPVVACVSTAVSVRRSRGILKSLLP